MPGVRRCLCPRAESGAALRSALAEDRGDLQSLRQAFGLFQQMQSAFARQRAQGARHDHAVLTSGDEASPHGADDQST